MSVIRTADWANAENPFWIDAITGLATTPNIQVSTLQVNNTGRIVLEADPVVPNQNAVIAFASPTTTTGLLGYSGNTQVSATGIVSQKYQITSLDSTGLAYDDLASDSLVLYGNNVVGGLPIASFKEYLNLNYLNIISPGVVTQNMYLSTLNVSSVNGLPYPPNGSNSNTGSNFEYLFARVADISSLTVSSLSGFSGGIQASSITTQVMLASTLAFQPSLGGLSPKIDLGMGGFLGGIAGSIGSGIFNTILGGAALATGIAGLMMPRGVAPGGNSTNLNSNNFELINGTTQLQISTLGISVSNILRFVSSAAPDIPGREIFISTIIPSGATCIRSLSDPLNLANPAIQTSSIQSFGQWTLLPFLSNSSNIFSSNVSSLTVSSINTVGWDEIQYWNMAPVNQGQFVVVNDANKYLYIGATLTGYPPPGSNPQYQYYSVELETGAYTYEGFVDMVNAVLGQTGGPSQVEFAIDPVSHIINIQNVNLNISPLTQVYTLIWNPSTGAPFASSNFSPAWTSNAITASSQLFGAGLSNVNQSPNPPSPLVFLPNPVPLATFTGPVAFGPYLQVSTINSASTITSPAMSTININLSTINGQPYTPGGGGGGGSNISASVSSLTVSSINTVGWNQIQYWNVAPTLEGYNVVVTAGSNDAIFMGVGSLTNPGINSNIVLTVAAGTYNLTTYCSAVRGLIATAPLAFRSIGPIPGILSPDGYQTIRYINTGGSLNPDYTYTIYFDTNLIFLFPGYTASRMTAVGVLQGADVNTDIVFGSSPSFADLPNTAGTPIYVTYPFSPDIQVSTLTASENIMTSYINNTSWNTIQYLNQNSSIDYNDRLYNVTTSNNVLCMNAINSPSPVDTFGFTLPVGTYTSEEFAIVVNAVVRARSNVYNYFFTNFNSNFQTVFSASPSPNTVSYTIEFTPAGAAGYGTTSNKIVGSAQLFGAALNNQYGIIPGCNTVLPIPNTSNVIIPPQPFGADLVVSSITVAGQGLLGTPIGSITMYAGNVIPVGYLQCDGAYYPISAYTSLYNALGQGQIYGISGSNFAVPDLQARFPMGAYLNRNAITVTISVPRGPTPTGGDILINTGTGSIDTTPPNANLITPDMVITFSGNTYNIQSVIWSGRSTTAPFYVYYLVSIDASITYDGRQVSGSVQIPASPPYTNGLGYILGGHSLNTAYNFPLERQNMAPHRHAYTVFKGGGTSYQNDPAQNASGVPNVAYTTNYTTDGTPGEVGFDLSPYNFSNVSGFTADNNNVTLSPTLPPFTIVNYIIKY